MLCGVWKDLHWTASDTHLEKDREKELTGMESMGCAKIWVPLVQMVHV